MKRGSSSLFKPSSRQVGFGLLVQTIAAVQSASSPLKSLMADTPGSENLTVRKMWEFKKVRACSLGNPE